MAEPFAAIREAGDLTAFAGRSLRSLPGAAAHLSETVRQAAIMVRGTIALLVLLNACFGATVVNFMFFFVRAIGATDFLGVGGYAAPRQFATTMFCFVFTAKVGCGMTAEIGTMRINEEVDALAVGGVDPLRYVVATRLAATLVFVPIATAIGLASLYLGQYLEAVVVLHGLAAATLAQVYWGVQTTTDQIFCLVTIAVIALTTATVACFYGLRTSGGPAAVGEAVARSVVINLVLGIVIASTFAAGFYGSSLRTGLGGG